MNPLVAVTLGNSTAALALVEGGAVGQVIRVPVGDLDRLHEALDRACRGRASACPAVIVSSVNPPALERFKTLATAMGCSPPQVAGADFAVPIRTDVDQPERVGTDRLLGALAAHQRTGGACVTVDCGTAITVNAVSAGGVFLGGAIMPGLGLMARSLAQGTALLPTVCLGRSAPGVGRSTVEAIAAGVLRGGAGAVTALIASAREAVGCGAPVVLTGGDAERIADLLPPDCRMIVPNLVIEGLIAAYGGCCGR